jgi:MFS transporter, putative metabolite transport protein
MYIADLIALALFSILSAFAGEACQLVILRFLLGVAIGADYPIATSLLAEYSPKKYRGFLLGAMFVVWVIRLLVGGHCTTRGSADVFEPFGR